MSAGETPPLLELRGVAAGGTRLDLTLEPGERVAVLGGEGSGKTRLLKVMAGLLPVAEGRLLWEGVDLAALPAGRRAKGIGVLFREPGTRFLCATPGEEIGLGLPEGSAATLVGEAMAWSGLEPALTGTPWTRLSASQRYRGAMAVLHAASVRLWLVDEPGVSLSESGEADFADRLLTLCRNQNKTSVIFTSREARALRFAERVIPLAD
ncbi:MAG: ATP-binding cassette domain-containing protein [Magnetococcales bacterium]|nr:ATP-binding cassette domain-containing protein [Magnetococcales bacterium]